MKNISWLFIDECISERKFLNQKLRCYILYGTIFIGKIFLKNKIKMGFPGATLSGGKKALVFTVHNKSCCFMTDHHRNLLHCTQVLQY